MWYVQSASRRGMGAATPALHSTDGRRAHGEAQKEGAHLDSKQASKQADRGSWSTEEMPKCVPRLQRSAAHLPIWGITLNEYKSYNCCMPGTTTLLNSRHSRRPPGRSTLRAAETWRANVRRDGWTAGLATAALELHSGHSGRPLQ